jgi:hypothetical protein
VPQSLHSKRLLATVETEHCAAVDKIVIKRFDICFFIELDNRRVYFAGRSASSNLIRITQQAQLVFSKLEEAKRAFRVLIHDRNTKSPNK